MESAQNASKATTDVDQERAPVVVQQEAEEDISLEQARDISPEEEEKLLSFLLKASKACDGDSSVPDFVSE